MKIAVIGARGFVGSSIYNFLRQKHDVIPVTRNVVDVLNSIEIRKFLQINSFDIIINAAATMKDAIALADTRNNLGLFMNFFDNRHLFKKFINLGSGAEFGKENDIDNAHEDSIFDVLPEDSYGFGQNIKSRLCKQTENFYTIRIFNCFGKGEISTRIFPRYLNRQGTFEIYNDRYFDYFSIQDLLAAVDHCINNTWNVKDVNAVYSQKVLISEALSLFCEANNLSEDFKVISSSQNNYTGNSKLLESLNITLSGLKLGFERYL